MFSMFVLNRYVFSFHVMTDAYFAHFPICGRPRHVSLICMVEGMDRHTRALFGLTYSDKDVLDLLSLERESQTFHISKSRPTLKVVNLQYPKRKQCITGPAYSC